MHEVRFRGSSGPAALSRSSQAAGVPRGMRQPTSKGLEEDWFQNVSFQSPGGGGKGGRSSHTHELAPSVALFQALVSLNVVLHLQTGATPVRTDWHTCVHARMCVIFWLVRGGGSNPASPESHATVLLRVLAHPTRCCS